MPPPADVAKYLQKGYPTHGILPLTPLYGIRTCAAHVTSLLKTIDENLTSYVFRDRMEMRIRDAGVDESRIKALMDHGTKTSAGHYQKTPLAKATAERVRQDRKKK
jgi:hypothetical protein